MTQSKHIAITGGIGSGKSTLSGLLRKKGYPVFSCDEISHSLWQKEEYVNGLKALFPDCVYEGKLKKNLLTERVFGSEEALNRLNAYSHSRIMEELKKKIEGLPLSFSEVPLLFEGGYFPLFDAVIVLLREEEARIASVCARDGLTQSEVLARMKRQFDYRDFSKEKCYPLENNGSVSELDEKLNGILRELGIDTEEGR